MEEAYRKGWMWLQIHHALFQEGIVDYPYPTFMYYKDRRLKQKLAAVKRNPGTENPDAGARIVNNMKPVPALCPARSSGSGRAELPVFKDAVLENVDKWL